MREQEVTEGDLASARSGSRELAPKMRFIRERWAKAYDHWLTNIQDWCISRQLWWGHRIPVWTNVRNRIERINWSSKCLVGDCEAWQQRIRLFPKSFARF